MGPTGTTEAEVNEDTPRIKHLCVDLAFSKWQAPLRKSYTCSSLQEKGICGYWPSTCLICAERRGMFELKSAICRLSSLIIVGTDHRPCLGETLSSLPGVVSGCHS